ncbi:MAG: hypothetical protein EBR82_86240 [Caulobacteraceae bacterium]|nr:hypothetical protein [Caulobacteraceae bacterium]
MALTLTHKEPSTSRIVTDAGGSGHWYAADGTPAHVIVGANGKERPTTVSDARKLKLYPSVTSCLGVMAKPNLVNWQIEMALTAALTMQKKEDEDLSAFAKRAYQESKEITAKAAKFGTEMHEHMEAILNAMTDGARVEVVCQK